MHFNFIVCKVTSVKTNLLMMVNKDTIQICCNRIRESSKYSECLLHIYVRYYDNEHVFGPHKFIAIKL